MRLIDADELEKKKYSYFSHETAKYRQVVFMGDVDRMPTIDAVPVVRCKDCKYKGHLQGATDEAYVCVVGWGLRGIVAEEDYCSYGVKKEADCK